MGTQSILNAPRHRTKLAGQALTNDRIDLRFLPEFGCHWSRLRVSVKGEWIDFLKPVADGDALLDRPTGQGSYIVAPWSHRIAGGAFAFAGKRYEVQPNLEDGSAIHGDVRLRPWETLQADSQSFEARLETQRFEDFNYPFSLVFSHRMELDGEQLRVTFKTENVDREPVPVGVGFHPHFLRRPTGCDEDVLLRIAADRVYPLQNNLPTAPAVPVDEALDFREFRPLGARLFDDCFTGLSDGTIRLVYPESRVELRLELDDNFTHVILHTPRGRDGLQGSVVAVEPLTQVSNAFNLQEQGWSDTGVRILHPGESWSVAWTLSVGDI